METRLARRLRKRGLAPSTTVEVIDDVKDLSVKPPNTPSNKRRKKKECSNDAPPFTCEICTDTKTMKDSFSITGCSHTYCSNCVVMYVRTKLEDNVTNIQCPVSGCLGLLEAEDCRRILPAEVFDRWLKAVSEAMIPESEKFYCPFPDCSALLIIDGKEVVGESECTNCKRFFCVQCKVPMHGEVTCEEFQKLGEDEREMEDLMLMELAKVKNWKRCPHCRFYISKIDGCSMVRCRCGHSFNYGRGKPKLEEIRVPYQKLIINLTRGEGELHGSELSESSGEGWPEKTVDGGGWRRFTAEVVGMENFFMGFAADDEGSSVVVFVSPKAKGFAGDRSLKVRWLGFQSFSVVVAMGRVQGRLMVMKARWCSRLARENERGRGGTTVSEIFRPGASSV
ncbi:probable E3 ubiquitin-protein ligase ARI9 [Lotus japonicus]|uniref:probable E3 ubiquitin-protein ligase ARI9 n=1 Tax=Lotus japonicus TaxID=34305 RepID=UPI00258C1F35|nr:probable E3 ubiquitin-protein ligase ARI9 [Lotus japonicus]